MPEILVSNDQMVRAFALWDQKFRTDPHAFELDVERYLKGNTPEQYGDACAKWFQSLLIDVR